jgi:fused signal recognition particle receptor
MKKISRVVKPNLKIFVVESIAGNSLIEQIREFKKNVGIDGIVLTKLDCDEKGGAILGISKLTDTPIYYISYGQEYDKIEKYEPAKFLEKILS